MFPGHELRPVGPFCPVGNIVKSLVTNQDRQALGYTIIEKQSKIGISVHYWAKTKLNLRQPVTAGADATVYVWFQWFVGHTYSTVNMSQKQTFTLRWLQT